MRITCQTWKRWQWRETRPKSSQDRKSFDHERIWNCIVRKLCHRGRGTFVDELWLRGWRVTHWCSSDYIRETQRPKDHFFTDGKCDWFNSYTLMLWIHLHLLLSWVVVILMFIFISPTTQNNMYNNHFQMSDVINGKYHSSINRVTIIDCRYPYEFEGCHIEGAVNLYTKVQIQTFFNETMP